MKAEVRDQAGSVAAAAGTQPAAMLTPHGQVRLVAADPEDAQEMTPTISAALAERLRSCGFPGLLLFELGCAEPTTALPAGLGFWRDLGKLVVERLCALPGETRSAELEVEPQVERLASLLEAAPPLRGGEYLSREILDRLWHETVAACRALLATSNDTLAALMQARAPTWHLVGRVHLHLAEQKDSTKSPFAFLATYTEGMSRQGRLRHLPLGKAVATYSSARDKVALASLLEPVRRAAEGSQVIARLLESGDLFHPLAWSADEAYSFLSEVPAIEHSGVVVKIPDWWRARSRPQVRVTVGSDMPSRLGLDALLDFSVDVALDGEALSKKELRALMDSSAGLVLLKGKWVEAAPERLRDLLAQWREIEARAEGGLSLAQAMRTLARADLGGGAVESLAAAEPEWCQTRAGPWLAKVFEEARAEDGQPLASRLRGRLHAKLRPYQEVGVRWLHTLSRLGLGACLADDMGLGKTIQVLALLVLAERETKEKRCSLLVVPASLLANWVAEQERFAPSLRLLVAHPSFMAAGDLQAVADERLDDLDVVLTSYGTMSRLPWITRRAWDTVILDEAQAIKNPGTRVTRAVKALVCERRIVLTGTPVENRAGDLWSIFDFLNPGLLGSAKVFASLTKRLAERSHDRWQPLRRLVSPYILRRLKSDPRVAGELPDKLVVKAHCGLSKRQAALYAEAVNELRRALERRERGMKRRGLVLAAMLRFQQICNHPAQWLGESAYPEAESGKLARAREICEAAAARQEKVLVFTRFRELTGPLAEFLAGVFGAEGLVLHGGTPVGQRGKLVAAFQSELGPPFFVLSLKAGGTGLNLTAANHVLHFDRWWNPAVEEQATDRAYRIGQIRNVIVHKLICRGTVEERVDQLMEDKAELAAGLLADDGEDARSLLVTEMSDDELMGLVALDIRKALTES